MDSLNSFSNFELFQSSFPACGNCSKCTNYNNGITMTLMFISSLSSQARCKYFFSFYFFDFHSEICWDSKFYYMASSLFFFKLTLGIVFWLGLGDLSVSEKPREFQWVSFSWTNSSFHIYHLVAWSNFNFLHNSQWITLPIQLCLNLFSFCTS